MAAIEVIQMPGLTPYLTGWELQRTVHAEVAAGHRPPTILLLEHESTYTAGRRTHASEYPTDGTPVIEVDRGGKITWHGPGQLVAYPILPLRQPLDVIEFLRRLEAAVIAVCAACGVQAGLVAGRSGVWVGDAAEIDFGRVSQLLAAGQEAVFLQSGTPFPIGGSAPAIQGAQARKVCAVGARVAKGVTMHGLALNCDPDLRAFDRIVPCGIADASVTSLSVETGQRVTVPKLRSLLAEALVESLTPQVAE